MPGLNKRDAEYTQARAELLDRMAEEHVFDLDEHDRGERVAGIVRELQTRFPELDGPMRRRLVHEGMVRTEGEARIAQSTHVETERQVGEEYR